MRDRWIKGLVKTSVIEYPGKLSTVVFAGGCNFRCPYCYNVDLVLWPDELPDIETEWVLDLLAHRRGFVDGVVVSGGEPTIQKGIDSFLRKVKGLNLSIKLDTNGSAPSVLKALASEGLIDYVAMDVKAPLDERYNVIAGVSVDLGKIEESIEFLLKGSVDYEFRTTVVPGFIDREDVCAIARSIRGAKRYAIQQFRSSRTLDPTLEDVKPYGGEEIEAMVREASRYVLSCIRR
jgi:pyruvate formate lyase activating enzyme